MENEDRTRRLNLTMLKKDYKEIQMLVEQDKYLSASEFVREAIREHIQKQKRISQLELLNRNIKNVEKSIDRLNR
ncbi:MAG: ribbon-helix-helix domain-containing protein [archaeon]|nr:ribbon-helix-helix domain-containing protein [archaeon]